jgi:hypothetical protein
MRKAWPLEGSLSSRPKVLPHIRSAKVLWQANEPATQCGKIYVQVLSSTVSEQSFIYVQWRQAVTLLPMIQTCKFIALQPLFPFMQHT